MTEHDRIRQEQALRCADELEALDDAIRGLQSTDDPDLVPLHDSLVERRRKLTAPKENPMTEEELLLRFKAAYPGVYLCVKHEVRLLEGRPKHEWTLWHAEAGEHVGPYAEPWQLAMAVTQWEESGERAAACQVQAAEKIAADRRQRLVRERLALERKAVADPSYIPTLDEAMRHPDAFMEGMTETTKFHSDPRD